MRVERDGARSFEIGLERLACREPVMNRCLYDLRGPRLPHGGVGGANSRSQCNWHLALFAPMPPGTDTARPAGANRQSSIALN